MEEDVLVRWSRGACQSMESHVLMRESVWWFEGAWRKYGILWIRERKYGGLWVYEKGWSPMIQKLEFF